MLVATHSTFPVVGPASGPRARPMVDRRATQLSMTQHFHLIQNEPPRALQVPTPAAVPAPTPLTDRMEVVPSSTGSTASIPEKLLVPQLARLASQHHESEYNRLKFGSKGSHVQYIPLSVQLPDHYKELRARQETHTRQKAWWLGERDVSNSKPTSSSNVDNGEQQSELSHSPNVHMPPTPTMPGAFPATATLPSSASAVIQQEISAAIASPLPVVPTAPRFSFALPNPSAISNMNTAQTVVHTTKTSESHPINISMIIPFEFLPTLSAQLSPVPSTASYPTLFLLSPTYSLDRVTAVPIPGAHTLSPFRPPPQPFHNPPPSVVWSQSSSSELLQSALNGENVFSQFPPSCANDPSSSMAPPPPPPPFFVPSQTSLSSRRVMTESPPVPITLPLPTPAMELPHPNPFPIPPPPPAYPTPATGVIRRPKHERASSAPPALALPFLRGAPGSRNRIVRNRSHPEVGLAMGAITAHPQSHSQSQGQGLSESLTQNPAFLKKGLGERDGRGLMLPPPLPPTSWASVGSLSNTVANMTCTPLIEGPSLQESAFRLGNMYLSSCPGKKVRLSGPVRGRGAICRDLRADLSRVRELGVGCVVCCLDDTELDFLGASWSEYSAVANELGLDVLRLPTPEGLAPLTPAALDAHLERLLRTYTLNGVPVLAHCRGGVGRAGLVACCWMLKLGLCGWKDSDLCRQTHTASASAWSTSPQMPSRSSSGELGTGAGVCSATIQLVERAIAVVRRRRSLKAVETYEQVQFLVDFVEHLDATARTAGYPVGSMDECDSGLI